MNHKGTKTLESNRLILRKFKIDDAYHMYNNWASSEEVTKYLTWLPHDNVDITRNILNSWISSYKNKDFYQWAIVLKEINEPIGSISVVSLDEKTSKIHIGYCIGEKWWNKGITSEALNILIDFFFKEVDANRIESLHDPKNIYSGKVMLKCNMKYEGTLRKSVFSNQGITDASCYAILKEEYKG